MEIGDVFTGKKFTPEYISGRSRIEVLDISKEKNELTVNITDKISKSNKVKFKQNIEIWNLDKTLKEFETCELYYREPEMFFEFPILIKDQKIEKENKQLEELNTKKTEKVKNNWFNKSVQFLKHINYESKW